MVNFIKTYAVKYWRFYLAGLFALIITNYITTIIPLKLRDAIDCMSSSAATFNDLKEILTEIIWLAISILLCRSLSRILIFIPGRRVEKDLRNDCFGHLLYCSQAFFRTQKTGDLISRMINDMQSLRATTALGFLHIINTTMMYTIVIYQVSQIDIRLTGLILLPFPILLFFLKSFVKRLYTSSAAAQKELGTITDFFVEMLNNLKSIKSYTAEQKVLSLFDETNKSVFEKNIQQSIARARMFPLIASLSSIAQIILLGFGGTYIINQTISLGEFVAISSYITMLNWPTAAMAWIINILQRGKAAWDRISTILNEPIKPRLTSKNSKHVIQSIEFKDCSFRYEPKKDVLSAISFQINAGETIGFYGHPGSGKSTIARLLAGLETPQENTVLINGTSYHQWNPNDYIQHVSYVPQDSFLFSLPVHENITFVESNNHNLETVKNVITQSSLRNDIDLFPEQLQTIIGERGVILSGGQKSRLSLARALYKPHQLLILDDVIASVDHKTEQHILHELSNLPTSMKVIISHRISALVNCDRIYVLENGSIVDSGSHENLIEKNAHYKFSWQYQELLSAS